MAPKVKITKEPPHTRREDVSNIQDDVPTNTDQAEITTSTNDQINSTKVPTSKISTTDTIDESIKEQAKKAAEDIAYCSDDAVDAYMPLKNFRTYMNENPGIPGIGLSCSYLANNLDILTVQRFGNGNTFYNVNSLMREFYILTYAIYSNRWCSKCYNK